MSRLLNYMLVPVVIFMAVAMVWDYYKPASVVERFQPAPPAKETFKYKTLFLDCSQDPKIRINYIDKKSASKDGNVPPAVKDDRDKKITAIAEVPPHKGKTTVISLFDMGTGKTSITFRQERQSFFGLESGKELGLRYGLGADGMAGALYGRYTFLRVGSIHFSGYAEGRTSGAGFIGLEGAYRW